MGNGRNVISRREACVIGLGAMGVYALELTGCGPRNQNVVHEPSADDPNSAQNSAGTSLLQDSNVWMVGAGSTGERAFKTVDWRDRPVEPKKPEWRFDPAGMPVPFDIDIDLYFGRSDLKVDQDQMAEAQTRMEAAAAETARLETLYESGEISAEECMRMTPTEEYLAMKDALEHGRLDWNPRRGMRDGFQRREYSTLPDEDATAADNDAKTCVHALVEYLWRKEGISLDSADWNISDLYPLLRRVDGSSPVTADSSYYGDETCSYTGYFYAELEKRSDYATEYGYEGYYWKPSFSVVFSPVGSGEHFRYGGMDGSQGSRFKELMLGELGPFFPLYEESLPPEGTEIMLMSTGQMQAFVGIDAFPALEGSGMLSEHLDEDVG